MADLFDNPMGLAGFEFVEFASPAPKVLEPVFERMGFTHVANHRSRTSRSFGRAGSTSLSTASRRAARSISRRSMARRHAGWPSASGIRTRRTREQLIWARSRWRCRPVPWSCGFPRFAASAARGCISSILRGRQIHLRHRLRVPAGANPHPAGHGLEVIDHLTHNVYRGRMAYWAEFYERIFNFREMRYFDIKGEHTGLTSRAMTAPDGLIRIPLNEEASRATGQIEEFLMKFNGEGIQHIALLSSDLLPTLDRLRANGVPMMSAPPATYYEMLDERLPGHGETVDELRSRGVLVV
jgi:4-hydroxyphenylpyruvate dioxygenase